MKKQWLVMGLILLAVGTALAVLVKSQTRPKTPTPPAVAKQRRQLGDYTISGPYAHENLAVFLIHGPDRLQGKMFLTLQEAMAQKKVVVHETSNVNELAIENVSAEEVYVQSGDIVKGGQQDRTLAYDLIVPPRSGKMPIAAFCVEHGRWSRRGQEAVAAFSSSTKQLSSKELKLAAKHASSQRDVWANVAVAQEKLSANVSATPAAMGAGDGGRAASSVARESGVASPQSPSSLQLALENQAVKETSAGYLKKLSPIVEGQPGVIGYAFAINGKVNSADVYASSALFKKLWPKLLEASAVEAIAELQKDKPFEPASIDAVKATLVEAEQGKASEKEVTKRIKLVTLEADKNLLFETRDKERKDAWIHRNYMTK